MKKWLLPLLIILLTGSVGVVLFNSYRSKGQVSVPLPQKVERIVSMAPNLTEILFALGLEEKIVGVTTFSKFPPGAITKPKIGSFWQPNIEAIINAEPDLVITLGFDQQKKLAEKLKPMGCYTLSVNIEQVSDLFEAIETIGVATKSESKADRMISDIKTRLDELSSLLSTGEKVKVLWVVQREPFRVAGTETFVNEMIELAGGVNAISPTVQKYPPIGAEHIIACGAQVIIEPSMVSKDISAEQEKAMEYWSKFKNVPAVTNGRIYVIDGDIVSRLGPRLCESVETIGRFLKPGLFEQAE